MLSDDDHRCWGAGSSANRIRSGVVYIHPKLCFDDMAVAVLVAPSNLLGAALRSALALLAVLDLPA